MFPPVERSITVSAPPQRASTSLPSSSRQSFDETGEHDVIPSNDPGDLDIPDFLR